MSYPDPGNNPYPEYAGSSGYPPAQGHGSAASAVRPSTVEWSFRLMLTRAVLSVIGLIVVLTSQSTLRDRLRNANTGTTAVSLDTAVTLAVTIAVVIGVIFVVLYVLLAFQVRKGKQWARVVTWVLAGLGVLSLLSVLGNPVSGVSTVISVVSGLLDVVIIVLLALRPSGEYVAARRQFR